MPAGPPIVGFLCFIGVKAVGYTVIAPVIRHLYNPDASKPSNLSVGLTRTVIGIAVGTVYGGLWILLAEKFHLSDAGNNVMFLGLLPMRFIEWGVLVRIYFDRSFSLRSHLWKVLVGGTIWSCCLDWIGILAAFILPGKSWIC